jgi:hypothetical protein
VRTAVAAVAGVVERLASARSARVASAPRPERPHQQPRAGGVGVALRGGVDGEPRGGRLQCRLDLRPGHLELLGRVGPDGGPGRRDAGLDGLVLAGRRRPQQRP